MSRVLDLEIMDPPGILPVFLGLTKSLTHRQRVAAARRAALVAFGVITAFALFGQQILHISLPALQGAGGLLLLLVALELLTGKESEQHADVGVNVAMMPLGTPPLAGPGAIVATMLAVQGARPAPRERHDAAHPHRRSAALHHRRADAGQQRPGFCQRRRIACGS